VHGALKLLKEPAPKFINVFLHQLLPCHLASLLIDKQVQRTLIQNIPPQRKRFGVEGLEMSWTPAPCRLW